MTRRNRALIKNIWFCVELEEYYCPKCRGQRPFIDLPTRNTCRFIKSMHDLFLILSTDSQHHFQYLTFDPDDLSLNRRHYAPKSFLSGVHDPRHGWIAGKHVSSTPLKRALEHVHQNVLAEVAIVSTLLLLLQNLRRFSCNTLQCMSSRFPNLETFHYEPWRVWSHNDIPEANQNTRLLLERLSTTNNVKLKRLVLFKNFDDRYSSHFSDNSSGQTSDLHTSHHTTNPQDPDQSVARAVLEASLRLEALSVSFAIEADNFFHAAETDPTRNWPHLRSLTLTTRLNQMLLKAALIALRMPELEMLVIWNGQAGIAALFRYQLDDHKAVLSWKVNSEYTIPSHVIDTWEMVKRTFGKNDPRLILDYSVDYEICIKTHADAISHLKLFHVVRPTALQQILAAHKARLEGLSRWRGTRKEKKSPNFVRRWEEAFTYFIRIKEIYHDAPNRRTLPAHARRRQGH
ncbi:hypothetical protein F5Y16DRAFT_407006 [Xylariaceae sp. FL0255]|nr:hypothetical protein F5Y16DRAFT_407006 [Xylariaceae sp. FL0255]